MEHETRFELAFPSRSSTSHTRRSLIALASPFRWHEKPNPRKLNELRLRHRRGAATSGNGMKWRRHTAPRRHRRMLKQRPLLAYDRRNEIIVSSPAFGRRARSRVRLALPTTPPLARCSRYLVVQARLARGEGAAPGRALRAGRFRFGLQQRITRENGEEIDLWSARDALVLKALALVLGDPLSISRRCVHVKGHGGAKAAIRRIARRLPSAPFVLKTDVGERFAVRRARLQERERTGRSPPGALGLYVRRWRRWTSAGLGSMETTGLADAAEWGLGGGFSGVLCATPPSEPCQANRDQ
jgi:hypothetical protein